MLKLKSINKNYIPPLTEPILKNWSQPDRKDIIVDDKSALMLKETFNLLQEYPDKWHTYCYPGKMYKRIYMDTYILIWFTYHKDPNKVSVEVRNIIII